jgi:AraC-like DNA-binding protein
MPDLAGCPAWAQCVRASRRTSGMKWGRREMPYGRFLAFDDPDHFEASMRAPNYEVLPTSKGSFHATLTRADFDRLWTQRSDKTRPTVVRSTSYAARLGIVFLADAEQQAPLRNGLELSAPEISVHRPGAVNHLWSKGPNRLAMMSLPLEDAAAAGLAIAGRELAAPRDTSFARPAPILLARLRALHGLASRLAKTDADAFGRPSVVKALEHDLIHAMIACLAGQGAQGTTSNGRFHARVMARFEDFLAARELEPVYLTEICAAIGTSERTLRTCCHERFGLGPMRYLWLRRMHLARHALLRADPAVTTVTDIATRHGFWELGRFSVEYRALFDESPSASLRRPPDTAPHPEWQSGRFPSEFA